MVVLKMVGIIPSIQQAVIILLLLLPAALPTSSLVDGGGKGGGVRITGGDGKFRTSLPSSSLPPPASVYDSNDTPHDEIVTLPLTLQWEKNDERGQQPLGFRLGLGGVSHEDSSSVGVVERDHYHYHLTGEELARAHAWFQGRLDEMVAEATHNNHHHRAASSEEEGSVTNTDLLSSKIDLVLTVSPSHEQRHPPPHLQRNQQRRRRMEEEERPPLTNEQIIDNSLAAFLCVLVAALAAGLTMGMLSIDPLYLMIKLRCGTPQEKTYASNILPLVQQHHRLLVTLLLLNSISNEALPLFLDKLVPSYAAVIISVTLVLIFGEILPSAVFTGPNQLPLASFMAPIVKIAMAVLCPIAYPIATGLDKILGHDSGGGDDSGEGGGDLANTYNRMELSALVRIMYEQESADRERRRIALQAVEEGVENGSAVGVTDEEMKKLLVQSDRSMASAVSHGLMKRTSSNALSATATARQQQQQRATLLRESSIHVDEVSMVEGALRMRTRLVSDVYVPLSKVFAIDYDTVLDERGLTDVYASGYSRIPVYVKQDDKEEEEHHEEEESIDNVFDQEDDEDEVRRKKGRICGILYARNLIVVDSDDCRPVSSMPLTQPLVVSPDTNMVDLLNLFQKIGPDGGHLALVCESPALARDALTNYGQSDDEPHPIPREANVLGIVTLEDVIEQLLQEDIIDESDKVEHVQMRRAKKAVRKWKNFVRKRKVLRGERVPRFVDVVTGTTQYSQMRLLKKLSKADLSATTSPMGAGEELPDIEEGKRLRQKDLNVETTPLLEAAESLIAAAAGVADAAADTTTTTTIAPPAAGSSSGGGGGAAAQKKNSYGTTSS